MKTTESDYGDEAALELSEARRKLMRVVAVFDGSESALLDDAWDRYRLAYHRCHISPKEAEP
ncbi:MAG: hypothetical protein WBF81_06030 [Thermoplasmata archaeon]